MSKKITEKEFYQRFKRSYPDCDITILEYTAISNPAKIKCNKCGKILFRKIARYFLNGFDCCGAHNETRLEKAKRLLDNSKDFSFIKKLDKDHIIVKHNVCGNEFKKALNSCLDNPYTCEYCNTRAKNNMLPIEEVQSVLDGRFSGSIQILDYKGQLEKNHYRCLKCGMIFTQKQICLMMSNGCPKCDRFKSMGEKQIAKLLDEKNVSYEEQYYVKELPFQHFDFAIFDDDKNVIGFIEVQGEQHFKENNYFKTPLKVQQERDNRKRKYCKKYNIPLYEIIYKKSKLLNLDILPF